MNLAVKFENASKTKDDMRKAYEECNDIPQEKRALIDAFLKEESEKDYEMHNALIRLRGPEIIRLGSQPDNPLVDHGREILESLTGADIRNANNMMLARNELLRSMAEKEDFIRNCRAM
ncbi:hypothetical protein Tco_1085333 [Tanacetum coccineum]